MNGVESGLLANFSEQPFNAAPPAASRLSPAKAIVVIVLLGWLAYANSLTKTFILDDDRWILQNDAIHDWSKNFFHHLQRPVVALSLTLNYSIGGNNPAGYHLFNAAIHIAAALALFGIVRRTLLLPRWRGGWDAVATPLGFAVAAVWVVHPLNTHSVTYVIQRCESGMGFCYVLAVYLMIRGSQSPRPAPWYAGSIAAAWVGVGCKEVIVTIVAVGFLYDRIFVADSIVEIVRKRWYLYLGWATTLYLPLHAHLANLLATSHDENAKAGFVTAGFQIQGLSWKTYVLTQAGVILRYLRLAVWPVGLCFDYSDWPLAKTAQDYAIPALVLGVLFLASVVLCLRRNGFGFLGMTFFLVLSVSSLVPLIHVANEYRTYVSLMAVVAALVIGGYLALSRIWPAFAASPLLQLAVVAPIVAGLLTLTYFRNEDYRSRSVMWRDVLDKRPGNFKAYADIGIDQMTNNQLAEARISFQRCLAWDSSSYFALLNLGILDCREDQVSDGLGRLWKAYDIYPTNRETTNDYLALFLHLNGQYERALAIAEEAKALTPDAAMPRYYRGGMLLDWKGCEDEGRKELAAAAKAFPEWVDVLDRGARDRIRGRFGDGAVVRREALFFAKTAAAARNDPELDATLADAFAWNGRYAEALAPLRDAIAGSRTPAEKSELEEKLKAYEAKVK